ncbi:MAG: hypothetical protein NTX65_02190 [Ignavibacteriales bacterium]|nr:hypothetical protein [Ignavibacteriales bacterium]
MKKILKDAFEIIAKNWKAYLVINILFYGLVIVGMIVISSNPKLHKEIIFNTKNYLINGTGLLPFVTKYYLENNIPIAIAVTFSVNLILATFIQITLPSLIIPFLGLLLNCYRAFLWGHLFGFDMPVTIYGVLLLEGQGYILAAFAIYLYGMYMIRPLYYGFQKRREAFIYGTKVIGKLYLLVTLVLLIAAVYEVSLVTSFTRFPIHNYPKEKINLSGAEVKLWSSGCSVYYDSVSVAINDAKVIGSLLEDIGYLKKGDYDVVKISKTDSVIFVKLYLEEKYWNDKDILKKFDGVKQNYSKMFTERQIRIIAFYKNESGFKKEKVL